MTARSFVGGASAPMLLAQIAMSDRKASGV
ncbi:DUF6053 domain-containing protein [Lysobacter sp. 2RAB21]